MQWWIRNNFLSHFFLCLKIKMLNKEFGGTVMKKDIREDGQFKVTVETSSALFRFVLPIQISGNLLNIHYDRKWCKLKPVIDCYKYFLFGYFRGLQSEQEVLLTHGDSIDRVASNLKIIAKSGDLVAGTIMLILIHTNVYSVNLKNFDIVMCNS